MEMKITFPGGKQVNAQFGPHTVKTDQPAPEGEGAAPTPFELFLAALGTCAGVFVLGFCQQRRIDTSGLELVQHVSFNPASHMVEEINLEIRLPADFPEKYRPAVIQAAQLCTVKRHLEKPPHFTVTTIG
jgi:putative redox protein